MRCVENSIDAERLPSSRAGQQSPGRSAALRARAATARSLASDATLAGSSGAVASGPVVRVGRSALVALFSLFVVALVVPSAANAQTLRVDLTEDPFVCDGGTRVMGTVEGFAAGEDVDFRSPQINGGADGIFSTREADDQGIVEMKWSCDDAKIWEVAVSGRSTGFSTTFTITGETAGPPPEAPLGAAFDAKSAMTIQQMAVWKDLSPYNGVGIYIPVAEDWDNRADKDQENLTSGWVDAILGDGWRILPIYVGHQAPASCAIGRFVNMSGDGDTAREQGRAAGVDAIASMQTLGIGRGAPVYLDIEGYRPGCGRTVIAYIEGWTQALQADGYLSGVYGSQSSVMTDLTAAALSGDFTLPDAIWVSSNSGVAGTLGLDFPPDDLWTNARIHQYRLSVTRTYGGVTREVDDNIVDAPVAVYQPPIVDTDGDGFGEPEPDNCDGIANPSQVDLDGDGDGDACDNDVDGDGVTDPSPDNCDRIPNPDQSDIDGDGDGDVCDGDIDGDFIANADDPDPNDPTVPGSGSPTPEPTPQPTTQAEPTVEATPEPAATAVPDEVPPPDPEPAAPTVLAVPTPTIAARPIPTATPTPLAAATATPDPDQVVTITVPTPTVDAAAGAAQPDASATPTPDPSLEPPGSSIEDATVTITTERDDGFDWRLIGLIASALAAVTFVALAFRSWREI